MAENKKSFIAYSDWKETFDSLPDEKAGQLIKHIFAYVNDENPISDDLLINAVFINIRNTLKRDLRKWELQYNQRVKAGKKSAEVRRRNATVVNGRTVSSTVSDSVNVNVNDSVSDNVSDSEKNKKNKTLLSQVDESTLDQKEKEYFQIALAFWELIKSNLTELNISISGIEEAEYRLWVDPIRLLMETDNRTIDEIREVFTFLKDDDFWKEQIRSTSKFRKKNKDKIKYFEVLLIKSRNEQRRQITDKSRKSGVSEDYKKSILDRLRNPVSSEEM